MSWQLILRVGTYSRLGAYSILNVFGKTQNFGGLRIFLISILMTRGNKIFHSFLTIFTQNLPPFSFYLQTWRYQKNADPTGSHAITQPCQFRSLNSCFDYFAGLRFASRSKSRNSQIRRVRNRKARNRCSSALKIFNKQPNELACFGSLSHSFKAR